MNIYAPPGSFKGPHSGLFLALTRSAGWCLYPPRPLMPGPPPPWRNERACAIFCVLKPTAHGATLFDAGLGREGAGSLTHPLHHALSRFRCFLGRNGGGFLRSGFMAATLVFSSWAFKQSLHARSRSKVVSCRWSPVENWTELSRLSKAAQARASVRLCRGTASLLPLFAR